MNEKKYPEYIMKAVRQRMGLEPEDNSKDDVILAMERDKVFDEVCSWNGFVGWANIIKDWVEDIYNS